MSKKLVVISGASQGIGRALSLAFADQGHALLLMSRHIEPFPELKKHDVIYKQVDVADYRALCDAIKEAENKFGSTDCLINNAGFLRVGSLKDRSSEEYSYEIDVLLKGVINGIKCVLPAMEKNQSGTVINISSIGDRKPGPNAEVYHACKAAVRSLTESLQHSEAKNNIRFVNVAPGFIKTNIHEQMGITFEEYCKILGNPTFITPEELAEIILFCYKQPQKICIRDIVIMPTNSTY